MVKRNNALTTIEGEDLQLRSFKFINDVQAISTVPVEYTGGGMNAVKHCSEQGQTPISSTKAET